MSVLDTSIANVAIPAIAGDLGVSPNQGTWVITSFAVSEAIMLPLTGWLAQRFGEVRLFLLSTLLFTLSSMGCGLAVNLPMLIFFRVLQGGVSAPMIPLSQNILMSIFPPEKKGLAISLWAMTAVIAPIFGPLLGGWLTYNWSWSWIFFINLPIGIFSTVITGLLLVGRETPTRKSPIDIVGLILLVIGVGALQILLDTGKDLGWFESNEIILLAIISFVSLSFLTVWELTDKHPVVDLSLFRERNFLIGTLTLCLGYLVFFANGVVFPLWLQTQLGYTATWAGLAVAPVGLLSIFFSPLVGIYMHKIDLRLLITFGFIIFSVTSFWIVRFNSDVSFYQLIEPRLIQGIGISFFFIPLLSLVIAGLPTRRTASALGLASFFRILGGSFGTSISVTIWDHREIVHNSQLIEQITPFNPISLQTLAQFHSMGFANLSSYELMSRMIIGQAYMLATNDFFWLSGCIFLILILIIWFAKPPFFTAEKPINSK